jgi:hypothetical protein
MTMNKITKWKRILVWYLLVWIVGLTIVLLVFWPKQAGIESENIKDLSSAKVIEPNKPTLAVMFEDANNIEIGRIYQISHKSDSAFVLAPVSSHISGRDFLILVLTMGAFGACLHGISSLALWVGKRKFSEDWVVWYLFRPFSGAILALLFYLIIRGGFLQQVSADSAGFYGIIGLSGLFGLFSKQALDKLSDIFDVLIAPAEKDPDRLKDQLREPEANPVPEIEDIEPKEIAVGQTDVEMTVTGKGFVKGCVVTVEGEEIETRFVSDSELKATLPEKCTAEAAPLKIAVVNPQPGGGSSEIKTVTVEGPSGQKP